MVCKLSKCIYLILISARWECPFQYNTFLGSAQIILFSCLLNFSKKNLNVKNFQNLIKVAIFEPTTSSTK